MISQTVEYALRAVVALAIRHDAPCTSHQLAEATKVPGPYLLKVMQSLAKAGLVRAQRGLHGGYRLVDPPDQITLWDVVQAVEPFKRIETCPLGIEGHLELCGLHRMLDNAMASAENAFRATTLASLVDATKPVRPLCEASPSGPSAASGDPHVG
jgi:Rrf2 family protein